jgi:RNA polymerase sigma-70 factor (ECF subfamily)
VGGRVATEISIFRTNDALPTIDSWKPSWRAEVARPGRCVRELDDAEVVRACLAGKERAYAELLDRYRGRVYGLALRMVQNDADAQDIAQEAFVKAFHSLASFDQGKPFAAWVSKITANLCIDHYRRRRLQLVSLDAPIGSERGERTREFEDRRPGPADHLRMSEEERRVEALLTSLPDKYRSVVLLRHKEDLSYEEIAGILGIPLGTVKARLHRAHNLLKRKLRPVASKRAEGD